MIRRFTSAQFVPANAGAKAKNPVGSTLFSTPMVALLRHPRHKILRTCCRESARKRLHDAINYVAERCKCETEKAGKAVHAALGEGTLRLDAHLLVREGRARVDTGICPVPSEL